MANTTKANNNNFIDVFVLGMIKKKINYFSSVKRLFQSGDISSQELASCVENGLITLQEHNEIMWEI